MEVTNKLKTVCFKKECAGKDGDGGETQERYTAARGGIHGSSGRTLDLTPGPVQHIDLKGPLIRKSLNTPPIQLLPVVDFHWASVQPLWMIYISASLISPISTNNALISTAAFQSGTFFLWLNQSLIGSTSRQTGFVPIVVVIGGLNLGSWLAPSYKSAPSCCS